MALIFVGTYTSKGSEGIYVYRMDPGNGALELVSTAAGVQEPSFLALSPGTNHLYAVNELKEHSEGPGGVPPASAPAGVATPGGTVSAFIFDPVSGEITPLNRRPSNGLAPCHLTVDHTGRFLLVANYGSGSVSVLPILADGRLGEASCVIQHEHRGEDQGERGKDPRRQAGAHAHSINLDSANRCALVPDLGIDRVMIYRFDATRGLLEPNDEPWIEVRPGAGPRHIAFHPNRRLCYLINELDSTMTVFEYDEEYGHLKEIQNITTLPRDFSGMSSCADVHLDPSGRFLYGSNRGHDSIVIYEVDQSTGILDLIGHVPTRGRKPRNFAVGPNGDYLLVANQETDSIVTFRLDRETGLLEATGQVATVPAPVCLLAVTVCP